MKTPCVYMLASKPYGTIYIGVTANLAERMMGHENDVDPNSFTSRYGVKTLVWFEAHDRMGEAIFREKRLKKYKRQWKIDLIEASNPHWLPLHPVFGSIMTREDASPDRVG